MAAENVTHHFSRVRLTFVFVLCSILVLIFGIGATVYFSSASVVAAFSRARAEVAYTLLYKPFVGTAQLAAAATANGSTGTEGASGNADAVPVLLYHGEGDASDMPTWTFVEQMAALKADGWHTVTMQQFTDFMKNGTPLPAKSFLLTFDDGRKDTFYQSDPVLHDLGFTASMFVITGFSLPSNKSKSTYYLDREELTYMAQSGRWDLESHGQMDHALYVVPSATSSQSTPDMIDGQHFLSNLFWRTSDNRIETHDEYAARIQSDLTQSQETLKNTFGVPATAFAFPFNDYGQDSANLPGAQDTVEPAVKNIYTFGFYQVPSTREDFFNYPDPSTYLIKRIEPTASMSGQDLVALLDGAAPKTLPYDTNVFSSEWIANWANVTPAGNRLQLAATPSSSGAATLLDGSEGWRNYRVQATVDWKHGEDISLIGRYQSDSDTFLTCVYSARSIMVVAHAGGTQHIVAETRYSPASASDRTQTNLAMSLHNGSMTCAAGGSSVSALFGSTYIHDGQIGIQVWDPTLGAAAIDVTHVSVSNI